MSKVKREEKYVVDDNGERVGIIIDVGEYKKMLKDLEELESIRAYDRAKKSGDEAVPFDQAIGEIEKSRS